MQDIIPISMQKIQGVSVQVIDARALHSYLKIKTKFSDWIRSKIKQYKLVENNDYITFSQNSENGGKLIEYQITPDIAKEWCLALNNEKGRNARQYFIAKEKELNAKLKVLPQDYPQALQCLLIAENEKLELLQSISQKNIVIDEKNVEIQNLQVEKKDLEEAINKFFKGAKLITRQMALRFLCRQSIEIKEKDITDWLLRKEYLCKGEKNRNKATAHGCRSGFFVNEISCQEIQGVKRTIEYGKFTQEGLIKLYNTFKSKN